MGNIAGLMSEPKYGSNIYRTGDIMTGAPFTVLNSEMMDTIIQLPLPVNLSSNMGIDWQQQQVGALRGGLMHNAELKKSLMGIRSVKDAFDVLDNQLASVITDTSEDIKKLIARAEESRSKIGGGKLAMNPRTEMMFQGIQFKSYSFSFNLVPYKKSDSDDIQKAIRKIQKASAPEIMGARYFLQYPQTWNIKFMSGNAETGNEYLMKINECSCTSIGVNYTPSTDTSNMHSNNAPLSVQLDLDFTEIFIPTKKSIDAGFNG